MANGIPLRPGLQPFVRPRASVYAGQGVLGRGQTPEFIPPRYAGTPGILPGDIRTQPRGLFDVMSQQGYAAPPRPQVPAGYTGFAPPPRPQPAVPAPRQPNLLERIGAIDPTSAAGQALGAAAATGLQLSGYRPIPITTAEGLGAMMAAGQKAFTSAREREESAREREQKAEIARQQRETDLRLKLMELQAAGAKTERELKTAQFGQEKDLRKEFVGQSKEFTDALLGFEKVQKAALSKEPTGASDIALVFGYMKVLDPNSVVREGEFATAANAGGVGERVRNLYNQVVEGKLLTPKVRKDFIRSAREQFTPYLQGQTVREQSFTGLSESYGLDPEKVVQTRLPKMGSLARPYMVASEAEAENLPKGSFVFINGRLAEID